MALIAPEAPRTLFDEPPLHAVRVTDPLWGARRDASRRSGLPHQWERLEAVGTVDNFRIAAKDVRGVRRGFFYADSDLHKWAEAAANALACPPGETGPDERDPAADEFLASHLAAWLDLVERGSEPDGYLFTWNQILFPGTRWVNLQIEHELYTLGHLVEAGVALHRAARTGHAKAIAGLGERALAVARRVGDLVVGRFAGGASREACGHPEIEIALVRLYRETGARPYLVMAAEFLDRRGTTAFFATRLAWEFLSHARRSRAVARRQGEGGVVGFDLAENLSAKEPRFLGLRALGEFARGRALQQHAPIREMKEPVGHAVRWGYLAAAAALVVQETGDDALLAAMGEAWERMVRQRTYVTGGVGALPLVEGFGDDYELPNATAYCETCAALASVFWSQEMLRATGEARYADLTEWQLHNAVAVGTSPDMRAYLYRNPLESDGWLSRRAWFATSCCPSNVSRTWAALGRYLYGFSPETIRIHQYVSSEVDFSTIPGGPPLAIRVRSELPWGGKVALWVEARAPTRCTLFLRVPSWAEKVTLRVEGVPVSVPPPPGGLPTTASGFVPHRSRYVEVERRWEASVHIELELAFEEIFCTAHPDVSDDRGRVAVTRGPVVYCLESVDNPDAGVPEAVIDARAGLSSRWAPDLLGGCAVVEGADPDGRPLVFVPYALWGNRGVSKMQVWVRAAGRS